MSVTYASCYRRGQLLLCLNSDHFLLEGCFSIVHVIDCLSFLVSLILCTGGDFLRRIPLLSDLTYFSAGNTPKGRGTTATKVKECERGPPDRGST